MNKKSPIFLAIYTIIFIIISPFNASPCGYEGSTKVEMIGFSKYSKAFALRYIYYSPDQPSECKYPKISGVNPSQVILYLYKPENKSESWTIYKDPHMDYGFNKLGSYDKKQFCTSHKKASALLKKAKKTFKNSIIDEKLKGIPFKISHKKDSNGVITNVIILPQKVMQKYNIDSSIEIYTEFNKNVSPGGNNNDYSDDYFLHSYFAESTGYGKLAIQSYRVNSFHDFRYIKKCWYSPDKKRIIIIYTNAAGPGEPFVIDLQKLSAKFLNIKGFQYHKQKKYNESLKYFSMAYEYDSSFLKALFNKACAQALVGQKSEAIKSLKILIEEDPKTYIRKIKKDKDLDSLRSENKFINLLK